MLDTIAAHIDFIHGNHIFGKIIVNGIIDTKFPVKMVSSRPEDKLPEYTASDPVFSQIRINFPFRRFTCDRYIPGETVP